MAAAIAQTIAIVDRSGKVVSTSKQFKNIFKEAKSAYRERKAEIVADREAKEQHELRKAIKAMSIAEESRSNTSRSQRRRSHDRHDSHDSRERRPELNVRPPTGERQHSGASARSGTSSMTSGHSSVSPQSPRSLRSGSRRHSQTRNPYFEDDIYGTANSVPVSPRAHDTSRDLVRSHTDMDLALPPRRPHAAVRSHSANEVDMDLAYGEYHPESLSAVPYTPEKQQQELSSLVTKAKMLLDEANCAQHSVKAIIAHLQKNPDAMAAVALTLAEISNIVKTMTPGALSALKIGAPSVFALLAAPEFLIAVGVGLGITVVMFGGYKIIKKIKARNTEKDDGQDEMLELGADVNRIEHWRRGIADSEFETASVATSVEGEFITPIAAASMGHLAVDPRMRDVQSGKKSKKSKKEKAEKSSKSSKGSRTSSLTPSEKDGKALVKVKKPSPLRRMFRRDDGSSTATKSLREEQLQYA